MARKLKIALALVPALVGTQAHALGLGGMRLHSALDQPFAAEIDLVDIKPDELDTLKAQIASQADFSRSGTERYHHLTKLRFSPQISPKGNPVIRVSSREPIREPYMDFLVEVEWPQGRLVKQYTLLLDPPVTAGRSAPPIVPPAIPGRPSRGAAPIPDGAPPARPAVAEPSAPPRVPAAPPAMPATPSPVPPAAPSPRPAPVAALPGGKRLDPVRPGTGLWRLARAHTPPGATVSQTALALFRNNPDAFINGDINRLRVGRTLVLPPPAEVFALSPEVAKQEFDAALRGKPVRRGPLTTPGSFAAGEAEAGDPRLRIAGAPEGGSPGGAVPGAAGAEGLAQDVLIARETSESARQETTEMRGRIRDLEAQLAEIQQLLKLRNEQLERFQGGREASPPARPGGPPLASAGPGAMTPQVPSSLPGGQPGLDGDLKNPLESLTPEANEPGAFARPTPPTGSPTTSPLPIPSPAGSAGQAALPSAGEASPDTPAVPPGPPGPEIPPIVTPVVTKAPPRPTAPVSTPPAEVVAAPPVATTAGDSTWRALLLPLAGVAGLTALGIGALTWLRSRRRLGRDSSVDFDSVDLTEEGLSRSTETVAGAAGKEAGTRRSGAPDSTDVASAETPSSAFAGIGRNEPETDEADAMSEADIYIAYGRYREAEELLRGEIRRNPGWMDLRFKLAEALFGAKNTAALRDLTTEIQAAGGDRSHPEQWRRLVELAAETPSEVARGGVARSAAETAAPRPAPAARPAEPSLLAPDTLGDSYEHGSSDVYVLDISDAQKPSADLALTGGAPLPTPERAAALGSRRGAAPAGTVGGPLNPAQVPVSSPISIEASPRATTSLPLGGQGLGFASSRMGATTAGLRSQTAGGIGTGLSDLDPSLEELRGGGDIDLFSLVDSSQTTQHSTETDGGVLELSTLAPVSEYPRVEPVPDASESSVRLPGIQAHQDDSASSDLLSSQWQMDSGLWDETATKLDLARAYLEMGDKESAKGILEEVGNEGNEDQRTEALELLRRLA